jgi:hypothetical protein
MGKDNYVTAKLKLDSKNSIMYSLGSVIVSSTHQVLYNGKWIFVGQHPDRQLVSNYLEPIIYCLNTSSKEIVVENYVFTDWDEITEDTFGIIRDCLKINYPLKQLKKEEIHELFDRGFNGNTMIRLKYGFSRSIKSIKLGDVLVNGSTVYGIVEIYGKNKEDKSISGNQKSYLENEELMRNRYCCCSFSSTSQNSSKDDKLYYLLTDKKTFYIGEKLVKDYNSLIDNLLEKNK